MGYIRITYMVFRFGISSMFFHEYACRDIFRYVSDAGFSAIEFWIETPDFWLRDMPASELAGYAASHPGLSPMTIHAPILDLNPCSINPRVAAASVEYAILSLGIAERAGAEVVTVHPGRRTAKRPPSEADFERFDLYLGALHEASLETGVKVGMENMVPTVTSLFCTPGQVREVLDEETWLCFTFDIAHALSRSVEAAEEYIRLCSDRMVDVHVGGCENGCLHLPVNGSATVISCLEHLRDAGYSGPLILELDDLTFGQSLSLDDKLALVTDDLRCMEECLG